MATGLCLRFVRPPCGNCFNLVEPTAPPPQWKLCSAHTVSRSYALYTQSAPREPLPLSVPSSPQSVLSSSWLQHRRQKKKVCSATPAIRWRFRSDSDAKKCSQTAQRCQQIDGPCIDLKRPVTQCVPADNPHTDFPEALQFPVGLVVAVLDCL